MSDYNCDCKPEYQNGVSGPIPPFWGFSAFTPTIPKLYWNVKSQEQRILNLFDLLDKLICYCNQMGYQIDVRDEDIERLKKDIEQLKDGGLIDFYEQQITQWIQDNLLTLWQTFAKQVYFGLDEDGYFVAYVPDSWSDIQFDTGMVYGRSDYGCLILRFSADGATDNTYSYQLSQPTKFEQLLADIESTTKRTDATYDTLFTNVNQEVKQSGNL